MQQLIMFTIKPRNEELDYSQKQREKKRSADNIILEKKIVMKVNMTLCTKQQK